jgi:hypothetical protein
MPVRRADNLVIGKRTIDHLSVSWEGNGMDEQTFDELTKSMSSETSRRAALRTVAAGLIAAIGGFAGSSVTAAARQRPDGVVCSKSADCLSGICAPKDSTGRRVCGCGETLIACNGACRSPYLGSCTIDSDCCTGFCYQNACRSCFIAGTRIAMADGTSRNIEDVLVGDFVLGSKGQANWVAGVERPLLGARSLHSLNGSRMFVTAEHPFATESGWKSIDPAATAIENASLPVGRLAVGDRLLTLASVRVPVMAGGFVGDEPAEIRLEPVALSRLEWSAGAPGTQLYNLLLDGDHAYFADDFLVHNKG